MAQELNDLINGLIELEESRLPTRVWQISDIAHGEFNAGFGSDAFTDAVARWYGNQPGWLWKIVETLCARSPALASWANSSFRRLLKAPAEVVFSRSVLERDAKRQDWSAPDQDVKRWFSALRVYLRTIVESTDTQQKLELVEQLWTNRADPHIDQFWTNRSGMKAAISKEWFGRSSINDFQKKLGGMEYKSLVSEIDQLLSDRKAAVVNMKSAPAREHVSFVKLAAELRSAETPEDLSLPGVIRPVGTHHLIRQVFQEIEDIFFSIGFSVVEGPEIETPYYNFEALNIPEFHPVRDDMDTFYLELPKGAPGPLLLRTHTSPVQIHTMEKRQPPVRVIVPGKVYRRDNPDATHSFMFHQIEGLAVDSDITFCDFTGTIDYFVKQFFGESVKTRFRPSYFPFTEPSVEFDVSCVFCGGSGTANSGGTCGKCKGSGWIELFGAGMVDPAVYGFVNYDPKKVSGFAFGIGIDRLAMLKYGIDDIQAFFQNDVRFLRQFP
jgi:phenylalanyl-tRNA synthetase alpha chain